MSGPTSGPRLVTVLPDAGLLAEAVAARLALALVDAQATRPLASVVLTGGSIAARAYAALAAGSLRRAVDWSRVQVWWGDERFLPSGHPDRNEVQARAALLDALPLDPALVHPMPAADGVDLTDAAAAGAAAQAAAGRYADELAAASGRFDVLLLGVGEDGHIASLFPGHPGVAAGGRAVGVVGSPKPPPVRVSLTLPTINTADEIWLVAAGAGKAEAVRAALGGADPTDIPAAGANGTVVTRWLLDRAAAAGLPG